MFHYKINFFLKIKKIISFYVLELYRLLLLLLLRMQFISHFYSKAVPIQRNRNDVYLFIKHPINLTIPSSGLLLNSLKFPEYAIISSKMDVFHFFSINFTTYLIFFTSVYFPEVPKEYWTGLFWFMQVTLAFHLLESWLSFYIWWSLCYIYFAPF